MATAKPGIPEVKVAYSKLDDSDLDAKIDRGITWGWNYILEKLALVYDVSTWAADCPPPVYDMAIQLAYVYASGEAVHTGQRLTASDEMAAKIFEAVKERLELLASRQAQLLDSSGTLVSPRSTGSSWIRRRTTDRVFTMDNEEMQAIDIPNAGSEWV